MIVKSLDVEGFGIIGEKISINFPLTGKIGVFGNNETGKSTLLDSISVALYGLKGVSKSKDDLVTWNKPKCKIRMNFEIGDQAFIIERK